MFPRWKGDGHQQWESLRSGRTLCRRSGVSLEDALQNGVEVSILLLTSRIAPKEVAG